jgi:peptide/nickel transport system ATP-binding protein
MEDKKILEVQDLEIVFPDKKDYHLVVDGISFDLHEREILGIVGESGSGKTMTALAIMGLLVQEAVIQKGSIKFMGKDLLLMGQEKLRKLKGKDIAMIFQEPMTSLNPTMKIGQQVKEMLILHPDEKKDRMYEKTLQMLEKVGLKEADKLYHKYPHQLSGGMRQRVMIAMAMICNPKLMIADEPTTALDVTVQMQILQLIKGLNKEFGTAVILISHDLGVINTVCTRALVMCEGKIVEAGNVGKLFSFPKEEYTKKLLAAVPKKADIKEVKEKSQVGEIILQVSNLNTYYSQKGQKIFSKKKRNQILKNVNCYLKKGEILGIVGESGSGKSTLAKAIVGLVGDYEGQINLHGMKPQMVFQDPYGSLNPAKKVNWILEEPLKIQGKFSKEERMKKVVNILKEVGLKEKHGERYISQLSGGQRQRVSIGCALINNAKIVILDEPVSSLDVTVQSQILELLQALRTQYDLSYIFISHDLNVIYQTCDRIGVMYQGEIIEMDTREKLYFHPEKAYTKSLLENAIKL